MNLELRKAALEATGWICVLDAGWYGLHLNGLLQGVLWDRDGAAWNHAPAVEFDPAVSEPWFLEWCEKNGYLWSMMSMNTGFTLTVTIGFKVRIADVWGATLSEARAKAVIAASKVKPNATTPEAQI